MMECSAMRSLTLIPITPCRMKGNEDDDKDKLRNYSCFKRFNQREMDVIEMAVYGSVKRDGLDCKCWSVGEMMNQMAQTFDQMNDQRVNGNRSKVTIPK